MSDIALVWDFDAGIADLAIAGADLLLDQGLRTAVIISLFTDRRADPDDVLPQDDGDRRGWWGDSLAEVEGDQIGSRLWLLEREAQTPDVLVKTREYAVEALAWLIEDGVASAVEVQATAPRIGVRLLSVTITRPAGPARQKFDFVWKAP